MSFQNGPMPNNNDRFILPFLGGALIGGAAVGVIQPISQIIDFP